MKYMLGRTLGCLVMYAVMAAGPVQAVNSAGPYYAEPSWDQKLPAATRFVVLTDWNSDAVLDRETGLVWEKSPDVTLRPWSSAIGHCAIKVVGGRKGWHLPLMEQLASLVDMSNTNPPLPTGHPFTNVQSAHYWSATALAGIPANAWLVDFSSGIDFATGKVNGNRVWCVRGGQSSMGIPTTRCIEALVL